MKLLNTLNFNVEDKIDYLTAIIDYIEPFLENNTSIILKSKYSKDRLPQFKLKQNRSSLVNVSNKRIEYSKYSLMLINYISDYRTDIESIYLNLTITDDNANELLFIELLIKDGEIIHCITGES